MKTYVIFLFAFALSAQSHAQDYSAAPCRVIKVACDNTEKFHDEALKSKHKPTTKRPSSADCMKKILSGNKYPMVAVDPGVVSACTKDLDAKSAKKK